MLIIEMFYLIFNSFNLLAATLTGNLSPIGGVGITLICIGVLIVVVTLFGCLGACFENKCMLLTVSRIGLEYYNA